MSRNWQTASPFRVADVCLLGVLLPDICYSRKVSGLPVFATFYGVEMLGCLVVWVGSLYVYENKDCMGSERYGC